MSKDICAIPTGGPRMTDAPLLRAAKPRDLETLLEMIREFYDEDGHDYDERKLTNALGPLLEDDRHGIVWLIGEPPAGYAVVTWGYSLESGGPDALLDEIYVREPGRGLGGSALDTILDDLRRRGLCRMFLETERHNQRRPAPVRAVSRRPLVSFREIHRSRRSLAGYRARHGFEEEDSVWMTWEAGCG